MKLIIQFT